MDEVRIAVAVDFVDRESASQVFAGPVSAPIATGPCEIQGIRTGVQTPAVSVEPALLEALPG